LGAQGANDKTLEEEEDTDTKTDTKRQSEIPVLEAQLSESRQSINRRSQSFVLCLKVELNSSLSEQPQE